MRTCIIMGVGVVAVGFVYTFAGQFAATATVAVAAIIAWHFEPR